MPLSGAPRWFGPWACCSLARRALGATSHQDYTRRPSVAPTTSWAGGYRPRRRCSGWCIAVGIARSGRVSCHPRANLDRHHHRRGRSSARRALAPIDLAIGSWKTFVSCPARLQTAQGAARRIIPDVTPPVRPPSSVQERSSSTGLTIAAPGKPNALGPAHFASSWKPARPSASSARRLRASRPSRALWSASGRAAGAVRLDGAALDRGSPTRSGRQSATCRRTSNCSPARWRRTSRRLRPGATRGHRRGGEGRRRARHDPRAARGLRHRMGEAARTFRRPAPARRHSPVRSTATPSWSFSTSPTPTSTPRASRRSASDHGCGPAAASVVVAHRPSAACSHRHGADDERRGRMLGFRAERRSARARRRRIARRKYCPAHRRGRRKGVRVVTYQEDPCHGAPPIAQ